jgi:hypothetical protein
MEAEDGIAMPTVLRIGSYRFHFYSDEGKEPAHIHVATPEGECKYWLSHVTLGANRNIHPHELRHIEKLVYDNREFLISKYNEWRKQR